MIDELDSKTVLNDQSGKFKFAALIESKKHEFKSRRDLIEFLSDRLLRSPGDSVSVKVNPEDVLVMNKEFINENLGYADVSFEKAPFDQTYTITFKGIVK